MANEQLTPYIEALDRLLMTLKSRAVADTIRIGDTTFRIVPLDEIENAVDGTTSDQSRQGILCDRLPVDIRRGLEQARISYLTREGHSALFFDDLAIKTSPLNAKQRIDRKESTFANRKQFTVPPTTLVSPAAFAILDVLIRLDQVQLQNSGLGIATQFKLSQSKLSRLMTAFSAKSPVELRSRIAGVSRQQWLQAMSYPRTKQRMTPFFHEVRYYRIVGKELSRTEARDWGYEVFERYCDGIYPGPPEVAKMAGLMSERAVYLWGDNDTVRRLKKDYRLAPTERNEQPLCGIAIPAHGFRDESILSRLPELNTRSLPEQALALNPFRVAWDLGFGDSRMTETQEAFIERVLNGV